MSSKMRCNGPGWRSPRPLASGGGLAGELLTAVGPVAVPAAGVVAGVVVVVPVVEGLAGVLDAVVPAGEVGGVLELAGGLVGVAIRGSPPHTQR